MTKLSATAAALLLSHQGGTSSAHTPFGYQSDSSESWELRPPATDGPKEDPSSYAGSVHYDPLHHALYLTGATYASGVYDGVDVYGLTTTEQQELGDEDKTNDGYWWEDFATGLKPHLEDLGVPEWGAVKNGDCFYAVLGLPHTQIPGVNTAPTTDNTVKVVHSRRFGSEEASEACSAIDILFTTPSDDAVGGYMHDFGAPYGMGGYGGDHDTTKPGNNMMNQPPPEFPGVPPPGGSVGSQQQQGSTVGTGPSDGGVGPDDDLDDEPPVDMKGPGMGDLEEYLGLDPSPAPFTYSPTPKTYSPTVTSYPTSSTVFPTPSPVVLENSGPQTRFRALETQVAEVQYSTDNEERELQKPNVPISKTRSVRLLMAGHIEQDYTSINQKRGYIIQDLPDGHFNEHEVYAFAHQVDVRLPAGDLVKAQVQQDVEDIIAEEYDNLDYNLHSAAKDEHEMAQELDPDFQKDIPKEDFQKIVTSGVESKALLNEYVPLKLQTLYPVALVADPTTKKHYYVVLLASDSKDFNANDVQKFLNVDPTTGEGASQRSWTDFHSSSAENELHEDATIGDHFGKNGRPNYGNDFRIIVKKMDIEAGVDPAELTDAEKQMAATSSDGELIAMRHDWMQEFEPDLGEDARPAGLLFAPSGNANGEGDVLIMVGTTSGRGNAFGTSSEEGKASTQDAPVREDLDGFVMKIRTDDGRFSGHDKFDFDTNSFMNTHSLRIKSNPGQDEIVAGVCAQPLRSMGTQSKMTHVYVVGSTSALLQSIPSGIRNDEFIAKYPVMQGRDHMEAFLMKVEVSSMDVLWTVQIGAFMPEKNARGNVFGYGCAVTRDGMDVYLTGLVKENGVVTDFSKDDYAGAGGIKPQGGTDVFISSYKTADGSRNFLKQVGSNRDDFPSRGNGGITTDRFGNAIITGNTRGSLMRKRIRGEFRYGGKGADAASDVFIMSFDRTAGDHAPLISDGIAVHVPPPAPAVPLPTTPEAPATTPEAPAVETTPAASQDESKKKNGALLGVLGIAIAFIVLAAGFYAVEMYRIRSSKRESALMHTNLHGRRGSANMQSRRRSNPFGMRRGSATPDGFDDLNIMVEVRNSASGGWHGVYDDEQLQAIDFGVPTNNDSDDVVEQSLFMEDGLQEIEEGLDNHYEIGEMDDVSDEDLIKAYNEAMALDIEPENPDVEFAMQGIGSEPILNEEHHQII